MTTRALPALPIDIRDFEPAKGIWLLFAEFAQTAVKTGWTVEEIDGVLREAYGIPTFVGKRAFLASYCNPEVEFESWFDEEEEDDDEYDWDEDDYEDQDSDFDEYGNGSQYD